jgi:hypothetical protein
VKIIEAIKPVKIILFMTIFGILSFSHTTAEESGTFTDSRDGNV